MATTRTPKNGGVLLRADKEKAAFCESVGSGNWTVQIWRRPAGSGRHDYRLVFTRNKNKDVRGSTFAFSAEDVLNLPKLTQVLSAALVNDGWLPRELKDDLACLAHGLDCFLGEVES